MQEDMQETEVRETTTNRGNGAVRRQTVARRDYPAGVVVAQRVVWFIVGVICIIIALRFVFLLLGANRGADLTGFIYSVSAPLVAPFTGIFGEPVYGRSVFEISSILAIVIYMLIGWGLAKLFTLGHPNEEV